MMAKPTGELTFSEVKMWTCYVHLGIISETGWLSVKNSLEKTDSLFQSLNGDPARVSTLINSEGASGGSRIPVLHRKILALAAIAKASVSFSAIEGSPQEIEMKLIDWSANTNGESIGHDLDAWNLWFALVAATLPYCQTDKWADETLATFCDPDVLMAMHISISNKPMWKLVISYVRKWQLGGRHRLPWAGVKEIAPEWKQRIAQFGDALTNHDLGSGLVGEGRRSNPSKAAAHLQKAAAMGHRDSQYVLGRMYLRGEGVPQDFAKAMLWSQQSARLGNKYAPTTVGDIYDKGLGVSKNDTKAVEWYRKSAEGGYSLAQFKLGHIYRSGRGVPKDYVKAAEWFDRAARQKESEALVMLGVMYLMGEGVTKDNVMALHLLLEGNKRGFHAAQSAIEKTRRIMTQEQIERAERMTLYS